MPVVEVDPNELRSLTDTDKSDEELIDDLFALGLELEGRTDEGELEFEFAPDRLDRLSIEGIARSLRYQYGKDRGIYRPSTNDPDWTIEVDQSVPHDRPYVTGAVARDVNLDEQALESLIQLQEKLHATMGRGRQKGAIGIHDLTMLKGEPLYEATTDKAGKSVRYTGIEPTGDRFVPLDTNAEMTPAEVLTDHPTGATYGDIVAEYDRYPAIYDDIGLFSFPPVINGKRTEVTTDSRDLFIEMTGTDQWTIDRMLTIVCYALDARGATIEEVTVEYDTDSPGERAGETLIRPDMATKTKTVSHDRIETIVGVDFDPDEVIDLCERSGLEAKKTEPNSKLAYEVKVPPYRVDVLHPVDIIDDIGRAFGFNDLTPKYPDVSTVGQRHKRSRLEEAVRTTLVGLGFEDMLNFHMINEVENFERMGLPIPTVEDIEVATNTLKLGSSKGVHSDRDTDEEVYGLTPAATIKEPYSEEYTILRTWAIPSLLMVLEGNTHRAYPQNLAEVGFVAGIDPAEPTGVDERRVVAGVVAHHDASYEDVRGNLQALTNAYGVTLETRPTDHPSFIDGRAATVIIDDQPVGIVGEFHPEVLVEHNLEVPVAGFEFDLTALD